jgi:hypothetical protein
MRTTCLLLAAAWSAAAQLPDFCKTVTRVHWAVRDLDRVAEGWNKTGLARIRPAIEADLPEVQFRGKPVALRVRLASGVIGDVPVHFLQPLGGQNVYTEFLEKHGDGVFSLMHRTPTLEAFQAELERLRGLGVGVLQRGTVGDGAGQYAYLDTEPQGKYVLGVYYAPPEMEGDITPAGGKISQFAFVLRDPEPASAFWGKLGFPAMTFKGSQSRQREYRGRSSEFHQELGWQRHGKVVYEWILSVKGPNAYEDHLKAHGEGFHHFGVPVEDMDKAIAEWNKLGYQVSQSGAWGEAGKPGSGRFAYIDTDSLGGVSLELLWNFRPTGK